jgi:hypothetical protein
MFLNLTTKKENKKMDRKDILIIAFIFAAMFTVGVLLFGISQRLDAQAIEIQKLSESIGITF